MTKFFDAMDSFFDRYFSGVWGWVLVLALGVVVVFLERATESSTPMILLAVPGFYMVGRSSGIYGLVKFCLGMMLVIFAIAAAINQVTLLLDK